MTLFVARYLSGCGSTSGKGNNLSLLQNVETGSDIRLTLQLSGYRVLFVRAKQIRREADLSLASVGEVTNEWSSTSTPPLRL